MRHRNLVVGSGPAGISAAIALLQRGESVVMLDGGQALEKARAEKLVSLAETPVTEWSGPAGNFLREGMESSVEGIPLKLAYGSDYPYRSSLGAPVVHGTGVNTKISLGEGGFSAVWGAAVLPYRQQDINGWPINVDDLAPHYAAILDFMPVAQQSDALAEQFPLFKPTEAMPLGSQAEALLYEMEKHTGGLNEAGLLFGRSRLAVNRHGIGRPGPCVLCGLCMYGCPYSLIYSSSHTLTTLTRHPNFTYLSGHAVQRFEEDDRGVTVTALTLSGVELSFHADRMFLAAGVLSSAVIMLRSLDWYDRTIEYQDSHYFLLPMLRLKPVPGFERRNVHTLAQLFLEIIDLQVSPYTVHLQTYTYNDLFENAIRRVLRAASSFLPWNSVLSRLFLVQGYLHSAHSPTLQGKLLRNVDGTDSLEMTSAQNFATNAVLKKVMTKLGSLRAQTGLRPLLPLLRRGEPGRGFHTGGSFPMALRPTGVQSDVLGRVSGMKRVHLIDASVLPSVPATTITYTVMANAHRIASQA